MSEYKQNILLKKNIILIPADYDGISNQKGVLTLEFKENKVICSLRCYNLKNTGEIFNVGIQVGDATFKTKASAKELSNLKLEINAVANNVSKISVVIVKLNEKSYSTLLWGSTETTRAMAENYFVQSLLEKTEIISSQQQNKIVQNFSYEQQLEDKQQELFEDEMLESYIDKVMSETSTDSQVSSLSNKVESLEETPKPKQTNTFFSKVENQVNLLLSTNQADELLEKIIPDSKFCRVQNGDKYYVFGVIYQQGEVKCICYGIPAEYSTVPPKEIDGLCQWLPLDANNYQGSGYWMTYQDALSGDNIVVEMIS